MPVRWKTIGVKWIILAKWKNREEFISENSDVGGSLTEFDGAITRTPKVVHFGKLAFGKIGRLKFLKSQNFSDENVYSAISWFYYKTFSCFLIGCEL